MELVAHITSDGGYPPNSVSITGSRVVPHTSAVLGNSPVMSETPEQPDFDVDNPGDPDADPDNLNPRDLRDTDEYEGDPDADPDNLNPREPDKTD